MHCQSSLLFTTSWWHHWLDGREFEWTPGVGDGQGGPGMLWFMGSQGVGHDWVTELNWTERWRIDVFELWCWRKPALLGSKITADHDCNHEMKRRLLLGRKVMTNLDSIFKSRDIILSTKVRLVKAMVFPIVMYGCESWTVKKAECQRIDAFELWCWRRLLRGPWTARRSNQSILKEISPGCSLERMMLKLKLQYFGHLM